MKTRILLAAIMLGVAGCSGEQSDAGSGAAMMEGNQQSAREWTQSELRALKPDTVVVSDKGVDHYLGAISFQLGDPNASGNEFTGRVGQGRPAGPKTVFVKRETTPEIAENLKNAGIDMKENSAYLLAEGVAYGWEAFQEIEFLTTVDPDLDDEEIAALFGLDMQQ